MNKFLTAGLALQDGKNYGHFFYVKRGSSTHKNTVISDT